MAALSPDESSKPKVVVLVLGAVLVQVGFGAYPVVLKAFSESTQFNTVVFSFFRDILCFPVLLLAAIFVEGKAHQLEDDVEEMKRQSCFTHSWTLLIKPRSKSDVFLFFFLGLFSASNQLFYILGLYCSSPNVAAIWQPSIPVWTVLIATLLGIESLPSLNLEGGLKIVGFLAAIGGAVLMNLAIGSKDGDHESSKALLGNVFFVVNTFSQGLYVIFQKVYIFNPVVHSGSYSLIQSENALLDSSDIVSESSWNRFPTGLEYWKQYPIHVTAWSYLFGAGFMSLVCVAGATFNLEILNFASGSETDTFTLPLEAMAPLVYAVFISSALCYGLITWLNKYMPASIVTAFWPFQIPVAVSLSKASGLDSINTLQIIGGCSIASGLAFVSFSEYLNHAKTRVN